MEKQTGEKNSFFSVFGPQPPTTATTSAQPTISTAVDIKDAFSMFTTSISSTDQKNPLALKLPTVKHQTKQKRRDVDSTETSSGFRFETAAQPDTATALGASDALGKVSSTEQRAAQPFTFTGKLLNSSTPRQLSKKLQKTSLIKSVSSYRPSCEVVTQARVLLLGPVSSGKSSFISSVQSVFNGNVTNRAMVGSSTTSFTKKLQSFNIRGQKGEDPTRLTLCDVMGLGDGEMTGLTLHDILSVIKGHVPEGHKFSPDQPVRSETVGYVKRPTLKDRIHCVAFVVDASKILTYSKGLRTTFQQLREHISDLGVHQVALLTHVDQICPETAKDVTQVYKSWIIQETMDRAGALLGMSTSYIVPVKNYSSELDLDVNTDVLLLSAVDHILQYADLYYQDNTPQCTGSMTYKDIDI